ncbi:DUF3616 domain-containing protein [Sphingobium sp. AR-3-1]|uniref:DUF3616 domain-containing protein n=1 Tax=Sphingobium psychrophilum TaxID=2728834 RepID=A0A7X9ZWD6_9SPHN|nr:DUF3616 domain-containing protein [Sphingobium psychrophilum]
MNDIWSSSWSAPAVPIERIVLQFGKGKKKKALRNFSAGTRVGNSLFLGADEHADIDRLSRSATGDWSEHAQFSLGDLLPLADPDQEVDLEGLSADDGWLWVLGSHARARPKVEKAKDERIDLRLLADLKDTRARCLLGRIPLVEHLGTHHPVRIDGHRRAGVLPQGSDGNALAAALARDPLIAPFIPRLSDQNLCAHWRSPIVMMRQG